MITGIDTPATIRQSLINSAFEFTLTGSRFFGNARPDSDWDFFTQDCTQVQDFLEGLGFEKLIFQDYNDCMTSRVYRHKGERIDIQCVKDATIKKCAQHWLMKAVNNHGSWRDLYFGLDKYKKDLLWDFAMCAASGIGYGAGHSYLLNGPATITEGCVKGLKSWDDKINTVAFDKHDPPIWNNHEHQCMQRRDKIGAVKSYRERTGCGVKEAKDAIEKFAHQAGLGFFDSRNTFFWM